MKDPNVTSDRIGLAVNGLLSLGLVRLSLALLLPFALMKANAFETASAMSGDTTRRIVTLPDNHCELDAICEPGQCKRYDPKKFLTTNSIATYFVPPGTKFGHAVTAVLSLLWLKLENDFDVYLEKAVHAAFAGVFEGLDETIPALEDGLCLFKTYPWDRFEGTTDIVDLLQRAESVSKGRALQIFNVDRGQTANNNNNNNIGGQKRLYQKYRPKTLKALRFIPDLINKANIVFTDAARRIGKKPSEVTYIGIHARRGEDMLDYRERGLGLENLAEDYYLDAMEYFREEYDSPVFIFVSDDMKWGRRTLRPAAQAQLAMGADEETGDFTDVFFSGCGDTNSGDCIARDFALLSLCNHSVTTHGAFGHWASYLAGGEVYTEYGVIVPDAYN